MASLTPPNQHKERVFVTCRNLSAKKRNTLEKLAQTLIEETHIENKEVNGKQKFKPKFLHENTHKQTVLNSSTLKATACFDQVERMAKEW